MHDLEHDIKYPVFKVVLYVKFGRVLTPRTSKGTGVEGRPKTLPYWLRATLRRPAELYTKVSSIV